MSAVKETEPFLTDEDFMKDLYRLKWQAYRRYARAQRSSEHSERECRLLKEASDLLDQAYDTLRKEYSR